MIVIRNRVEAPWDYPDLQMEALNKLERLIQLPFMSEIKVDAIQWPSLKAVRYRGVSLDAYYAIDRTTSEGNCEEFKSTLQTIVSAKLLCRKAGEEKSLVEQNRSVVKLELIYKKGSVPDVLNSSMYMQMATTFKPLDGQCLYPIQIRPKISFHEPSKLFPRYDGYAFEIVLEKRFLKETDPKAICDTIKRGTTIEISECHPDDATRPKRVRIMTTASNDGVLNVMSQLMKQLNEKDPASCFCNVALIMQKKDIPEK
ncbi:unnamed protein product [Dicrocoelium dendriticum]|nr:unnamed protein product [Dicrocoelium dendriticum]